MSGYRGQAVALPSSSQADALVVLIPGFLGNARDDITPTWLRIAGGNNFEIGKASGHIVAKVAPHGTAVKLNLAYSTNNGASWASLLPVGGYLTLNVGAVAADIATPTWVISTLTEGNLVRCDLVQSDDGTCYGVTLSVEVK